MQCVDMDVNDLRSVVRMIPREVREILKQCAHTSVAGGFVRDTICGEKPSDIDIFGPHVDTLKVAAMELAATYNGRCITTNNAITVVTPARSTVQFITRWTYPTVEESIQLFDFTMCKAAVFWRGGWCGIVDRRFYQDVAARRLTYTNPQREEEPGGSMLRAAKFLRRGWRVPFGDLGKIMARMEARLDHNKLSAAPDSEREALVGQVFAGLLLEVDPLTPLDGYTVAEEHEPEGL